MLDDTTPSPVTLNLPLFHTHTHGTVSTHTHTLYYHTTASTKKVYTKLLHLIWNFLFVIVIKITYYKIRTALTVVMHTSDCTVKLYTPK